MCACVCADESASCRVREGLTGSVAKVCVCRWDFPAAPDGGDASGEEASVEETSKRPGDASPDVFGGGSGTTEVVAAGSPAAARWALAPAFAGAAET